ncbi:MAG: ribosomal protein S18-alanine N-acetyltransferase [Anaerolineae bacterium]|nr:ribosomal protein S18-alanine N-acetyltransferase [Anaerolineae bacterium]
MSDSSPITIRPMKIEDVNDVVQIDQLSFVLPWPERSFRYEINQNQASRHWVAEISGENGPRIVAMLVCWVILDEAHIGTIAVHPDYRRLKIGERLLNYAFAVLAGEGILSVFLEVRRSNEAARTLYRKLGFTEDGVRKRYYKDNYEDAILMHLENPGSFANKESSDGSI